MYKSSRLGLGSLDIIQFSGTNFMVKVYFSFRCPYLWREAVLVLWIINYCGQWWFTENFRWRTLVISVSSVAVDWIPFSREDPDFIPGLRLSVPIKRREYRERSTASRGVEFKWRWWRKETRSVWILTSNASANGLWHVTTQCRPEPTNDSLQSSS